MGKERVSQQQKLEIMAFFASRPGAHALFWALLERLGEDFSQTVLSVQKTQITLKNPRVFACISLPRSALPPGKGAGILVSFGLPHQAESPRILRRAEPYPNRVTHHVLVTEKGEIDAELLSLLKAAYEFSLAKGRRGPGGGR